MSDFSDGNEVIMSSEHGITIEKSFDGDEFAVPAIRFELQSDCDDPVTVRLTDRIPNEFPMDNVGFHPEYENENWTAYKDHRVRFERTLEPGEQLTTVYGIRLSDWQEAEAFLTEPELEEVTPVTAESDGEAEEQVEEHTITDIVSEDSSQVVRDVIAGDSGLPGLDDTEETDPLAETSDDPLAEATDDPLAEADPDPLGGTNDDPLAEATDEPDSESDDVEERTDSVLNEPEEDVLEPSAEDEIDTAEQPASPPRPGSVAAALADEIRAGEINDADLKLIQRELDFETPESTNVRIRHLQSRVDDLSAYTEALEEFIDDNGSAQTVIDDFESEVESLRDELGEMDDEVESAKDEGAQARARVADLETNLSDLESKLDGVDDLGENLETLESQLNDLEDLVATNTQEVSALDDEIEDLRDDFQQVKTLETRLETVSETVSEIETLSETVADLSETVEATESRLDEKIETIRADLADTESELDEVETLQSDIDDIEAELDEFREWRDQLGSVFGGN